MVAIDLDSDLPVEESFLKYVMENTLGVAKKRGLERGDFVAKARSMFKPAGGILDKTLVRVVPAEYDLDGLNWHMQGTADSDIENLRMAASLACHRWCRANDMGQEEENFVLRFYVQKTSALGLWRLRLRRYSST